MPYHERWDLRWRSRTWRWLSLEERYEELEATMYARHSSACAVRDLFGNPFGWMTYGWEDLQSLSRPAWVNVEWEEIQSLSRRFFVALVPLRRALAAKAKALADVVEQKNRYLPAHATAPEVNDAIAARQELLDVPDETFGPRPELMSEHALVLYKFLAQRCLPDRRRGLKWQGKDQPYNETAMRLVGKIIEHYYGVSVSNPKIKARLQAARRSLAKRP